MIFEPGSLDTLFWGYALQVGALGGVFYVVEKLRPIHTGLKFLNKDFKVEFLHMIANDVVFGPLLLLTLTFILSHTLFYIMPDRLFEDIIALWPFVLQILAASLFMDLLTYLRHRFTHYYWWHYHAVHHSALEITWLTKNRLHPLDLAMAVLFDVTGMHLLGFSPDAIYFAAIINTSVDYFAHANLDVTIAKPWRYLINNPRLHRWHHANQIEAYNKNFCSTYPLWDLLFGTYHYPEGRLPDGYGIAPKEQAAMPVDYLAQLLHPVKTHGKKLRRRFSKK
jgi:sterol desaturase/sphingolipid hydroxylase (fatty acid hydroxylase superfamily)